MGWDALLHRPLLQLHAALAGWQDGKASRPAEGGDRAPLAWLPIPIYPPGSCPWPLTPDPWATWENDPTLT